MKYCGIEHAWAYLVQALIAQSILEDYDWINSPAYLNLYEPLISSHNDVYPGHVVSNPVDVYHRKISSSEVFFPDYSYEKRLLEILDEKGIRVDYSQLYHDMVRMKWISSTGRLEKAVDLLEFYTRTRWRKLVFPAGKFSEAKGLIGYFIYYRYVKPNGRAGTNITSYSRISDIDEIDYTTGTLLVFQEVKENG